MTRFSRRRPTVRSGVGCALLVVAALALTQVPIERVSPLQETVSQALRPGQMVVRTGIDWCATAFGSARALLRHGDVLAQREQELALLRQANLRLQAELNWLTARMEHEGGSTADEDRRSLLQFATIPALVLGHQARRQLSRHGLLDAGQEAGVQTEALVLDDRSPWIDRGTASAVQEDDWLLAGRAVWGRVVRAGTQTSVARQVTDAEYRDVVEIVHRADASIIRGPRGVLEGTGEALCRIRLVPTTEGVAVGDWVYASTREVGLWAPLLYGRVERIEQLPGAVHWEIWMRPAIDARQVERVAVLKSLANPVDVAVDPRTDSLP